MSENVYDEAEANLTPSGLVNGDDDRGEAGSALSSPSPRSRDDDTEASPPDYEYPDARIETTAIADLGGKVAVIVAASNATGQAFSFALLDNNVTVVLVDSKDAELELLTGELSKKYITKKVFTSKCDYTDDDQLKECLKKIKESHVTVDIIINCASFIHNTDWKRMLDINLGVGFALTEIVIELFGKNHGGPGATLIHISSYTGLFPNGSAPVYSASKSALVHYVRTYSVGEVYKRHGIKMMCICPAVVRNTVGENKSSSASVEPQLAGQCLIDVLQSQELGPGAVIKLSSDKPEYIHKCSPEQ